MSLIRLSRPGHPTQLIPQGPAHARVQGVGGAALGYFSGVTLTAKQRRKSERRMEQEREAAKRYRERRRA